MWPRESRGCSSVEPSRVRRLVWSKYSGVGPLELELDLLLIALPLMLDVELGTGGHVDSLPGNLDLEPLARLQRIGKPSQLRHELRGGVDLLDVSVSLFVHRSSPDSPNARPLGTLQGPRPTAKSERDYSGVLQTLFRQPPILFCTLQCPRLGLISSTLMWTTRSGRILGYVTALLPVCCNSVTQRRCATCSLKVMQEIRDNEKIGFADGQYACSEEELYKKAIALLEKCRIETRRTSQEIPEPTAEAPAKIV